MPTEELLDWPTKNFALHVLAQHPAPRSPVTGERMWESGIRLHGAQRPIIFDRYRYKKVDGGIRAGKSLIAATAIYLDMLWREKVTGVLDDIYGVIGASYEMAEEEMNHLHRLLDEGGFPHTFHQPEKQAWRITFPHKEAEVRTLTSGDVKKIAMRSYRAMVLAEAAQHQFEAWRNARERVVQSRGWVLMEGTFEDAAPWYRQMSEAWNKPDAEGRRYALPSWDNRVVFPGGRTDPAILAAERADPMTFLERYGGEPQKSSKAVFPQADERWIVKHRYPMLGTSYDPEQPVYLGIDPGTAHAYAVPVFQCWENVVWMIDIVYRWNRTTEDIVAECAGRRWAKGVKEAVMDFAGTQRRSEGPPNIEQWSKLWRKHTGSPLMIHANPVPLTAGYDVHRGALQNSWPEEEANLMFNSDRKLTAATNLTGPRLMIDPIAAAPLFGGMVDNRIYNGEYNLHHNRYDRYGTVTGNEPVDRDNDAIKAITYFLYWYFGPVGTKFKNIGFYSMPWELVAS